MSLDFAEFLLSYTDRFFLKAVDALSLAISLVALIVSIVAIIMTLSVQFPNEKTHLLNVASEILILPLIGMVLIYFIHKNNNQNVFKVEESIFLNYDWINRLSIEDKKIIFGEVKEFYKTKGKNIKKLISL